MISVFSPSDKDLLHCHQSRDPWPVFTFKQHYWKYYLWKTGLCFGSRFSHRLIMLHSQLICRKARRMRGRKCWVWTELQTQTESNLLLGSWRPRLHCARLPWEWIQLCCKLYYWNIQLGNHKKTFSNLIPKVLEKEFASVLLLPVSVRDKKSKHRVGWRSLMQKPLHIIKPFFLFVVHSYQPLLPNFICSKYRATFVEICPRYVGRSGSVVKSSPTSSAYLPPFFFIKYWQSSSTFIWHLGPCTSGAGHLKHCRVTHLKPPSPSSAHMPLLVPTCHCQQRARPSSWVDEI